MRRPAKACRSRPVEGATRCRHARHRAARRPVEIGRRSAKPHHHRHAARAGQHGDMARRAAAVSAMPPPALQSVSRKRVGAMSSPKGWRPAGTASSPSSVRARSTWSRMSLHVGGAGAEILVVGHFVADDLGVDAPDARRSSAGMPSAIAAKAGPVSASSSSMASWNSRIAALSSPAAVSIRLAMRACACSIAARAPPPRLAAIAAGQIVRHRPGRAGTAARRRSRPRPRCPSA